MKSPAVVLLIACAPALLAQSGHFEVKSPPLKLRIVTDTIPPVITVNPLRWIEKGFRLVQRDSAISVSGYVTDNEGAVTLQVNRAPVAVGPKGKFLTSVRLRHGDNRIALHAVDAKGNPADTAFSVYQDAAADTLPPAIAITEPYKGRGFQLFRKTPTIRIGGTVTDETPLSALYVNGMKVDSVWGGLFHCVISTDSLRAIYVKAVDSSGNVAVDSIILPEHAFSIEPESGEIPAAGRFFALLIGVQEYKDPGIHDLSNPIRDASKLEAVLRSHYGFTKENILLLKNPNRDKILDAFEKMKAMIREDDNFLVYYAGHGNEDKDAGQGYWWPSDADRSNHSRWISNADLRDQIKRIKSRHTLLIADACFSGSVFRTSRGDFDNADIPTTEAFKKKSRTALTSGEEDVPDESVFSTTLIQILTENTNRYLRGSKLFNALHDEVMSNSPNRQFVSYGAIQEAGDTGTGDFVFIRRSVEPSSVTK